MSIKKYFFTQLTLGVLLFAGGMRAWTEEPAAITVTPTAVAPVIDGALDDDCWKTAEKIEHFYERGSDQALTETTVWLAYDAQWLYLGVDCRNPHMTQVRQKIFKRNGPVFMDDSLMLFVRPDRENKSVYELVFSFANVQYGKRFLPDGARDDSWNGIWRSATHVREDGWSGEMAVPLCLFETENLSGMQINLVRNMIEIKLDDMGALESDQRVSHAMRANWDKFGYDLKNFVALGGMDVLKPQAPFLARIAFADLAGYVLDNGQLSYGVDLAVESGSPVAGTVELILLEERGAGFAEIHAERLNLAGMDIQGKKLSIPVEGFADRRIMARLVDGASRADILAERELDTAVLQAVKRVFVARSYYTTEPAAQIRVELGMPDQFLREMSMHMEVNGEAHLRLDGLKAIMTPEIPLAKLKEGENQVSIRLIAAGKNLATRDLIVRRLAPRPGYEVKLDFIKGIMLKNEQPFFPVGVYAHFLYPQPVEAGEECPAERVFKFLGEDIGMNTIVRVHGAEHLERFVDLADKYGLDVITWSYPQPDDLRQKLTKGPTVAGGANAMPLEERLKIWREWYEAGESKAIEETKYLRERRNFIGYYNIDEPNLPPRDFRLANAEWYWKTVTPLDPYRPVMLLFAKHIPEGEQWTRWGGILGYDVYPSPHKDPSGGSFESEPGWMTLYYAYDLRERCRQDNKVMWFVPAGNLFNPLKHPVGLGSAHILCQAYAAIIYGARGLLYFALPNILGPDAWDGLRMVSAQSKELAPALLNGDIAQDIRYPEGALLPLERKFPMVNAAVFQYPEGDYLLLAVNIRDNAAQTEFRIAGLQEAKRLFVNDGQPEQRGDIIAEKIEGYGVRAWRLRIEGSPEIVRVDVASSAIASERAPRVNAKAVAAKLRLGKNHIANPCFRQQTNRQVPDFYKPNPADIDDTSKDSKWFVDDATPWNGMPSLRLNKRMMGSYCAPALAQPDKMTFSFYARGSKPGASIRVSLMGIKKAGKSFKTTTEWTRYSMTFTMPRRSSKMNIFIMAAEDDAVWINGLQLEQNETPTEFSDDSVL